MSERDEHVRITESLPVERIRWWPAQQFQTSRCVACSCCFLFSIQSASRPLFLDSSMTLLNSLCVPLSQV
uniref:Uncharacterized protein n=1 Tax=Setaria viridis TaxID=4556 RepID=A0A4U6TM34_SETVI|nr:hypothetical protein SEVIR_9G562850v2 [Setaria viridis]